MHHSAVRLNFLLFGLVLALCFLDHSLFASGANATIGKTVTFSVSAEGTAPFSYQWIKDSALIDGANSAIYTIGSLATSDSGNYAVQISNSAGSTQSDVALLSVSLPPVIGGGTGGSGSSPTSLGDTSFEDVSVGVNSFYAFFYDPLTSAWRFTSNAGVTGDNSGFTSGNPNAPHGSQVAFIQLTGTISQDVVLSAGSYVISAQTANRANWGGQQSVLVYVDTQLVGTFTGGAAYSRSASNAFTVTSGVHTIAFIGTATTDSTLFLDQISLTGPQVSIGNSGFEQVSTGVGGYSAFISGPALVPGSQDWFFSGSTGIAGNGSGYTSGNPNAPDGTQVAYLQASASVIAQTISFPVKGSYSLSFHAAQRGNWNEAPQRGAVYLDNILVGRFLPNSPSYETFTFSISTTQGRHELKFRGTTAGDSTLFIDTVSLTPL